MMVQAIKQGAHTSAHTLSEFLYFIFCTTLLFSNVIFLCFYFSSCSWVKFWKRSFSYVLITICSWILLDTLFVHSICVLFYRLACRVFIFRFPYYIYQESLLITADQNVLNQKAVVERVSKLNLKSRPASIHLYFFIFLFFRRWCMDNLDELAVWKRLGRGVLRNFSLLKKA